MTWRRFSVLLGGLSVNSRFFTLYSTQSDVIDDPEEAERYVASLLG